MKCYHPNTYVKLGFDEILRHGLRKIPGEEARERWSALQPWSDPDRIQLELERVQECKNLLEFGEKIPGLTFNSVGKLLAKIDIPGNWLTAEEMYRFLQWLIALKEIRDYLAKHQETYPHLHAFVSRPGFNVKLIQEIKLVLDDRGKLRDNASPELARIRKAIHSQSRELRSLLNRLLKKAIENNWTVEKEITFRNDRLVIPIRADFKGRISGFVQDMSQSGGTIYIEPTEALVLNNQIRELKLNEHNEIIRILQELTARIAEEGGDLAALRETFLELEIIRTKAMVGIDLKGCVPQIDTEQSNIHLKEAYYPVLQLKAREEPIDVIPLEVSFTFKKRILLISGPNAGGKTVALKTIGLLQLMLQCGFMIPVDEGSTFRFYDSLFIDIGDEQSVASNLSTYTSHLALMREMGDNMNAQSLFLIDEFGSGTAPHLGGAIAESFLERFLRVKGYGVITTHYGNLKDFAELHTGIINAAMEFDTEGLKPTYKLIEGIAGRSYAFEIAKRVGVHPTILKRARKKVGTHELDVEKLRRELEQRHEKLQRVMRENERRQQKLDQLLAKHEALQHSLKAREKEIIQEAKREARTLIKEANKKIEHTIRAIREKQAEKKATQKLRIELQAAAPEPEEPVSAPVANTSAKKKKKGKGKAAPTVKILEDDRPIQKGDWVKLKASDSTGVMVEIKGKQGVMESGSMRVRVKLNQLVRIAPPETASSRSAVQIPLVQARLNLDVLGKRVEEALPALDLFIDQAHVAGLKTVRILHGKGTGTLRQAIRNHLKKIPFVTKFYDAGEEEGGAGWTICELN